MAKKQYRYSGESKWAGLSGNAILALYCVPGSGKKITVHSVEIYNKNQLGRQTGAAVDTFNLAPQRINVGFVSTLSGGESVPISELNSASTFPSTIQVKTRTAITPNFINWNGSVTYTDATVAVGDVTFTPGSAPAWIANEHRDGNRVFIGTSGNIGTYRIVANTTTDLTVEPPFTSAVSTTGYIAEVKNVLNSGVLKTASPAIANVPVSSNGYINQNFYASTGSVCAISNSADTQGITVRAGEKLAMFSYDYVNGSLPLFVEATLQVAGSPARTYQVSFYSYFDAFNEAILTIDNNVGSGEVIKLIQFSVSEVGTLDTPYFQVVPIGSIDPASFDDTDKQLTPIPNNSANGALSTSEARLFTNVPVIPAGVPISYIAEGAPTAAVPRGFNYLNSKDFIGPVYATYFPEAAAYKIPNTAFWTAGPPGTMGSHVSQEYSRIKGYGGAPIVIREGEALGIVSGAETATLTTAIGISGFGAYEFSISFTVENTLVPSITLTGLVAGSDIVITTSGTNTVITETDSNPSTSWTYEYENSQTVDIGILKAGYIPLYIRGYYLGQTNSTLPISQVADRNYQ